MFFQSVLTEWTVYARIPFFPVWCLEASHTWEACSVFLYSRSKVFPVSNVLESSYLVFLSSPILATAPTSPLLPLLGSGGGGSLILAQVKTRGNPRLGSDGQRMSTSPGSRELNWNEIRAWVLCVWKKNCILWYIWKGWAYQCRHWGLWFWWREKTTHCTWQ